MFLQLESHSREPVILKRYEPNLLREVSISDLSGGDIAGLLKDFSAMRQWHVRCTQIISDAIKLLNTEQCSRKAADDELLVTDHAVVR